MKVLVTGGAGFIGCHVSAGLARAGADIVVADNLSRAGSVDNLGVLEADPELAPNIAFRWLDVRDAAACLKLMAAEAPDAVVHLAGQVAVTGSIIDPTHDFDTNARGTLNVLEAVRASAHDAHIVFASTNKVYGRLEHLRTERTSTRYILADYPEGIPESFPTDAATPYGCSKLAADGYVRDHGRTYGLRSTVLRMSCIYGTWQNGTVDQGWVSWFVRAALTDTRLMIYGDGLQVRDLLHVDDLVNLLRTLLSTGGGIGETFNIGGGPEFSLSVWGEFGPLLEEILGHPISVCHAERRTGDQSIYVSDIRRAFERLGWRPQTPPRSGVAEVTNWTRERLSTLVPVKESR